ncbi:receptor-transporting protein 4-like isoform X2 [Paroedura picta]|uniref:receptor-transporting protein 4-like isoform X2 n=1 Tax=Paroedura picta TaxID=143630 RepID=UPI0040574B95
MDAEEGRSCPESIGQSASPPGPGMGFLKRFTCSQCCHTWSSHQVVILFHVSWERALRQGQVRMRIFRQECHRCRSPQKEEPQFAREDMESVVQHLILDIRERCYRERVQRSVLSEVVCEGRGPHRSESCEACQMGLHKGCLGKPGDALHHGKSGRAQYCGSSQTPNYFSIPYWHRDEGPPVPNSWRGSCIQPAGLPAVPTFSCPGCTCRSFCLLIFVACIVLGLVGYWEGWFWG